MGQKCCGSREGGDPAATQAEQLLLKKWEDLASADDPPPAGVDRAVAAAGASPGAEAQSGPPVDAYVEIQFGPRVLHGSAHEAIAPVDQAVALGGAGVDVVPQSKEWAAGEDESDGEAPDTHAAAQFERRERRWTEGALALGKAVALGGAGVDVVPQSKEWAAGEDESDAEAPDTHAAAQFERRERRLTEGADALGKAGATRAGEDIVVVSIALVVLGLEYSSLAADSTLRIRFEAAVREAVASARPADIEEEQRIDIRLSSGSVNVEARMALLAGSAQAQSALSGGVEASSNGLATSVLSNVKAVPGIENIATGEISVEVSSIRVTFDEDGEAADEVADAEGKSSQGTEDVAEVDDDASPAVSAAARAAGQEAADAATAAVEGESA